MYVLSVVPKCILISCVHLYFYVYNTSLLEIFSIFVIFTEHITDPSQLFSFEYFDAVGWVF